MIRLVSFLFVLLSIVACNKPEVRVNLLTNNTEEIHFQLKKGDIVNLYSSIDIEYKEKPLFVYHCQFYFEDALLFEGGTDPLVIKDTLLFDQSLGQLKLYGKLDGNLTATKDGVYSVKTTFVKNHNSDLKINKAEIVFVR